MDSVDMFSTPNKKKPNHISPTQLLLHSQSEHRKFLTPTSMKRKTGPLHLFNSICNTPPSRFPKIINPFEAQLADRLHLPLICSPSLFHRPSTPQLCSTQFEWTIEDVSSLNPANVEAHETQFISTFDPETEAKAQAAINSYFSEKIYVPSPIDCVLRNQKIILKDETFMSTTTNNNTAASSAMNKKQTKKRRRDGCCQTELTFPPILPKNIENLLGPYFTYTMNQQQTPSKKDDNGDCDKNNATAVEEEEQQQQEQRDRDASLLRRKLFETSLSSANSDSEHNFQQFELVNDLSPPPKSPDFINIKQDDRTAEIIKNRNFGSPDNAYNNNKSLNVSISPVVVESSSTTRDCSFGSLSPISKNIPSPRLSSSMRQHSAAKSERLYLSTSSIYQSTPERMAAARCHLTSSTNSINMSVDGGGSSIIGSIKRRLISTNFIDKQAIGHNDNDDDDDIDNSASFDYDDETSMSDEQVNNKNQLLIGVMTNKQHNHIIATTPRSRRKNRMPNRKNLSQSFLYSDENTKNCVDDELMEMQINTSLSLSSMIMVKNGNQMPAANNDDDNDMDVESKISTTAGQLLCRTDSGFNETEDITAQHRQRQSQIIQFSNIVSDDISMMMTDV